MRISVTKMQRKVLTGIKKGYSSTQIAKILGCSVANVSQIVCRLQRKYPQLKVWKERHQKFVFEIDEKDLED